MASQSKIEARKAILRARGMPEAFIDNLANRKEGFILSLLVILLLVGLSVAFIGSSAFLSDSFAKTVLPYLYADGAHSLLFYAPRSVFSVIIYPTVFLGFALFLIAVTIWVQWHSHVRPFPNYSGQASYMRNLATGEVLATIQPNIRYAELAHLPDDTAFLNAIRSPGTPFKSTFIILLVISIVFGFMSLDSFSRLGRYKSVTLDSIKVHDGSDVTTYRLADAKYAYVLCYDSEDTIRFRYRIVYPDGVIDLWQRRDDLHDLGHEGVLDRLTLIDQKLTKLGIPIHRMPLEGSPYFDGNGCINDAAYLWRLKNPDTLRRLVFGPQAAS